jgi:hypothetical protein
MTASGEDVGHNNTRSENQPAKILKTSEYPSCDRLVYLAISVLLCRAFVLVVRTLGNTPKYPE